MLAFGICVHTIFYANISQFPRNWEMLQQELFFFLNTEKKLSIDNNKKNNNFVYSFALLYIIPIILYSNIISEISI